MQKVKEVTEAIDDFLKVDNDDNQYQELLNRRISDEIRDSMEGNMSLQDMTKALNEDMKGTSAPRVHGFTNNLIQKNWELTWCLSCKNCK